MIVKREKKAKAHFGERAKSSNLAKLTTTPAVPLARRIAKAVIDDHDATVSYKSGTPRPGLHIVPGGIDVYCDESTMRAVVAVHLDRAGVRATRGLIESVIWWVAVELEIVSELWMDEDADEEFYRDQPFGHKDVEARKATSAGGAA